MLAAGAMVVVPLFAIRTLTSTSIPLPTSVLTGLIALAFAIHPIEAQYDDEEDGRSSSHCKVIEADFEHVLVRLRFNGLGATDRAAIAGPHYRIWIAFYEKVSLKLGQCLPNKCTLS